MYIKYLSTSPLNDSIIYITYGFNGISPGTETYNTFFNLK